MRDEPGEGGITDGGGDGDGPGGTYALRGIPVFRAGDHRGKEYTDADLEDMARNFALACAGEDACYRVPIVLGHSEDQAVLRAILSSSDIPAGGWAAACWADGGTLYADAERVQPELARLVRTGAYREVSAEVYDEPPPGMPAGCRGKMLRRIAFLGAEPPEVKGLGGIPDPEPEGRFAEHGYPWWRFDAAAPVLLECSRAAPCGAGVWAAFSEAWPMVPAEQVEAVGGGDAPAAADAGVLDADALAARCRDAGLDPQALGLTPEQMAAFVRALDAAAEADALEARDAQAQVAAPQELPPEEGPPPEEAEPDGRFAEGDDEDVHYTGREQDEADDIGRRGMVERSTFSKEHRDFVSRLQDARQRELAKGRSGRRLGRDINEAFERLGSGGADEFADGDGYDDDEMEPWLRDTKPDGTPNRFDEAKGGRVPDFVNEPDEDAAEAASVRETLEQYQRRTQGMVSPGIKIGPDGRPRNDRVRAKELERARDWLGADVYAEDEDAEEVREAERQRLRRLYGAHAHAEGGDDGEGEHDDHAEGTDRADRKRRVQAARKRHTAARERAHGGPGPARRAADLERAARDLDHRGKSGRPREGGGSYAGGQNPAPMQPYAEGERDLTEDDRWRLDETAAGDGRLHRAVNAAVDPRSRFPGNRGQKGKSVGAVTNIGDERYHTRRAARRTGRLPEGAQPGRDFAEGEPPAEEERADLERRDYFDGVLLEQANQPDPSAKGKSVGAVHPGIPGDDVRRRARRRAEIARHDRGEQFSEGTHDQGDSPMATTTSAPAAAVGRLIRDAVRAELAPALRRLEQVEKFSEQKARDDEQRARGNRLKEVRDLLDGLTVSQKSLPPASRARWEQALMAADDSRVIARFSEGGKTVGLTHYRMLRQNLLDLPAHAVFGEAVKDGGQDGGPDAALSPDERKVAQHYDAFSEAYGKHGLSRDAMLEGFRSERKLNPNVTAETFLNK